jgi:hypothetical protein
LNKDKLFIHVWLVIPVTGTGACFSVELASVDLSEKEQIATYCLSRLPDSPVWQHKPLRLVVWVDREEKSARPSTRAKWQIVCGDRSKIKAVLERPLRMIYDGATR